MVQSTSSITSISSMPLQQAAEAIDTDTSTNASSAFPQAIPRNLTRPRASPILPYRGPSTPQPRTRSQSRPPSYPHTPCGAPPPCPSVLLSFCPFVPLSLCPFLSLLAPPRPSRSQRERGLLPPVSDAPASRHWWKAIQTQPPQRGRRTLPRSSIPAGCLNVASGGSAPLVKFPPSQAPQRGARLTAPPRQQSPNHPRSRRTRRPLDCTTKYLHQLNPRLAQN
jgi:hypothetical protein